MYAKKILYTLCVLSFLFSTNTALAANQKKKENNTKQEEPLEITADTLNVYQEKNQAVFIGAVKSVQGTTRLNSDKMTVFYKDKKESPSPTKKNSKDSGTLGSNSIQKIEVEGKVFLSTPEDTAQGKRGDYNLETGIINLYDSVILTQGKNVITGEHLIHNRSDGTSHMMSGQTKNAEGKKTRVKSVFIPSQKKEAE